VDKKPMYTIARHDEATGFDCTCSCNNPVSVVYSTSTIRTTQDLSRLKNVPADITIIGE
jgi:hypothetical protein